MGWTHHRCRLLFFIAPITSVSSNRSSSSSSSRSRSNNLDNAPDMISVQQTLLMQQTMYSMHAAGDDIKRAHHPQPLPSAYTDTGLYGLHYGPNYECMETHLTYPDPDPDTYERRHSFTEGTMTLRNRDNYEEHLRQVEADPNQVSNTRIARKSVLNDLDYFHVTQNYTPDVMHDLLEGVCPYIMKLILKTFIIDKKLLTVDFLNQRIKSFNYGPTEFGNKSTEISRYALSHADGHTKQSAIEMWCLMVNLPLLIADQSPEDDPHWGLYVSLLEIVSIVFAPALSEGATYYLQEII